MTELDAQHRRALLLVASTLSSRLALARALQGQTAYEGDRDYYEVLGYPKSIGIENYTQRYERQDIAARVVDIPAFDTWKKPPKVSEEDKEDTAFIQAWIELVRRLKVWSILSRADRLSGIGRYGIIFVGLKDNSEDPAEPLNTKALGDAKDVLYYRPFSELRAMIKEWDDDTQSPRYGMPNMYEIRVEDDKDNITVHHTRIIHLADGKLDSEVYGTPRLRSIYNLLDDMIKVVGGTAEATWLNMRPGMTISPIQGYKWANTPEKKQEFLEEVDRYAHDPLRILRLIGMQADQIGMAEIMDPSGPFGSILSLMAASTSIPQRVLTGSAAGELSAAKEDTRQWAQFISNRQINYAEPEVLRPFIDYHIKYGLLPAPADGLDAYDIGTLDPDGGRSWPSLIELSEQEQADATNRKASAVKHLANPLTLTLPLTEGEARQLLGYPEKRPEEELPVPPTEVPEEPEEEELPEGMMTNAIAIAIQRYRDGDISADDLAAFALAERIEFSKLMEQALDVES